MGRKINKKYVPLMSTIFLVLSALRPYLILHLCSQPHHSFRAPQVIHRAGRMKTTLVITHVMPERSAKEWEDIFSFMDKNQGN